jgi:hypothetical protein
VKENKLDGNWFVRVGIIATFWLVITSFPSSVLGQQTTVNCNSTTYGNSTDTTCRATTPNPNAASPGAGALEGIDKAMQQARENAQRRRALNVQEQALNQEKKEQDRQFELQSLSQMQQTVQTFIKLPNTNDPSVIASRNNLVQSYNALRGLTCQVDESLAIPDIDGTPNSCALMAKKTSDLEVTKAVTGACEDYAAKHPAKVDGHTFKAWGNRSFTCVRLADGTISFKEN